MDLLSGIPVGSVIEIAFAVHALALAIVNLTATPKDNEYLAKAYRLVEFAAGFFSLKAKQ